MAATASSTAIARAIFRCTQQQMEIWCLVQVSIQVCVGAIWVEIEVWERQ